MKLLIGIPTGGQPTAPFLESLRALELPPSVVTADRLVWTGNFVPAQREMIVRDALARGTDVLVMIDDDIALAPDALVRLLGALDAHPRAAVAGALYYSRDSARPMIVGRWSSEDTTTAAIPAFRADETATVDGVGFGCVAVRLAALRPLEPPYFSSHLYVDTATRTVRQCDEDYLLCERVRAAGWNVLVHAGVRARHYDRGRDAFAPERWETDEQTDRLRMIVRDGAGTKLVPFDDAVGRVEERHEPFGTTLLIV